MRKFLATAIMAASLAWANPSAAETILFDVNGATGGGVVGAATFDWLPGNSLLIERTFDAAGNTLTGSVLFQANLGSILNSAGGTVYTNGVGGEYFTLVSAFNVTFVAPGIFSVDAGGTFKIYADTAGIGDNLAGTGFVDTGATSKEILSGTTVFNPAFGTGSLVVVAGPDVNPFPAADCAANGTLVNCLDQAGDNNDWENYYSYSGTGSSRVTVLVDSFDSAYFLNLIAGASISFTSTENSIPYRGVDPSRAFSSNAVADGDRVTTAGGNQSICDANGPDNILGNADDQLGTAADPCINGDAFNIMAETDARSIFQGVTAIPEPATLSLFGLGLVGLAAARRRQLRNRK